mmetsp:Transcript_71905/g.159953  ORF Transcript_71905/g.159953 Transcript_71905/m.159953 type:complete len:143 (-) Transcript_71905:344-772(-)|eukprot:CAMPEP_0181180956 /NCGR_PEP_ID=MMETSP1096-20121128/7083_1 /TAXON_ID=156174 ORGANISM="Chrysochromulina ericina, Strain CCMP281" /NCGR_SAMPLE_ID=MMETSP1096 /ASSEMBLY_ACC=CAM_ASM_000453 /LENGTH=142 /DNA_ID=CAMNT_0023269433 /DNA_START=53 /DNA_END=481 /DNA_ORIENTATION=-
MVRSSRTSRAALGAVLAAALGIQILAARAEFGVPVFLGLLILGMFTLGVGERWAGDTSAYSVFNRDGVRLAGTLTAEQIDGQMRRGGGADATSANVDMRSGMRTWGAGQRLGSADRTPAASEGTGLRERMAEAALSRVAAAE